LGPFVREQGIPLSTADSYVKQHELSLSRTGNVPTKEVQVPTREDVTKLVKKLESKLRSVLTTPDAVTQFIDELGAVLNRWETPE
jgi:hypothetical protein